MNKWEGRSYQTAISDTTYNIGYGTINIHPCSEPVSVEHMLKCYSPSSAMLTSSYEWKCLHRNLKKYTTSQFHKKLLCSRWLPSISIAFWNSHGYCMKLDPGNEPFSKSESLKMKITITNTIIPRYLFPSSVCTYKPETYPTTCVMCILYSSNSIYFLALICMIFFICCCDWSNFKLMQSPTIPLPITRRTHTLKLQDRSSFTFCQFAWTVSNKMRWIIWWPWFSHSINTVWYFTGFVALY